MEPITFAYISGKDVTITVKVTNVGGQEDLYSAILKIDGTRKAVEEISICSGQSREISFTVVKNERGPHVVEIGELSGGFVRFRWIDWWLIVGLSAALVIIFFCAWYYGYCRRKAKETM